MAAIAHAVTRMVGGVVAGVDTHADTIHVGVLDSVGRELGNGQFTTSPAGYADALAFVADFGAEIAIGIEGSSSYGAGIARAASRARIEVREVTRPQRSVRRMRGKSDPIDAYEAARAVLSGHAIGAPKGEDIEALRALSNARRSAVKARTAALNQILRLPAARTDPERHPRLGLGRPDRRPGHRRRRSPRRSRSLARPQLLHARCRQRNDKRQLRQHLHRQLLRLINGASQQFVSASTVTLHRPTSRDWPTAA